MIEVLRTGSHMCLVDQGRTGYGRYGIPTGGAMDMHSYLCGQSIAGNDIPSIAIEMYQPGHQLVCHGSIKIVITGADAIIEINGTPHSSYKLIEAKSNDVISIGAMSHGCRIYLSVAGGIDAPTHFGSIGDIPGHFTNILRPGDRIKTRDNISLSTSARIRPLTVDNSILLDGYSGPEYQLLSDHQKDWLLSTSFSISSQSNRMGIRSEGIPCPGAMLPSILTSPTLCGTVQLPADGLPIILMRDAQTTGGYPRVLLLDEKSINQLAQRRPGQQIQFSLKT